MFCPSEVCAAGWGFIDLITGEGLQWSEVVDVSRYVPVVDSLDSTNGWSFSDEKEEKCEYDRIRFVCTLRLALERASWSAAGLVGL
ncbi:hypothetical protein QR685DRAFT_571161 [Neurospora intermedia]|uniref:Uncharacterized protein n=1 Tax=Neurospora intermedia TaxID=5142 RepID=A0ABR3DIU1_NEUIN